MRDLVRATKALSDETRLRMMSLLIRKECCVCEVMQVLSISQTRASRNLRILYEAGFLKLRKEGLWSYYSLDGDGMTDSLSHLVESVKSTAANSELAARDTERLRAAKRVSLACTEEQGENGAPASRGGPG